MADIVTPAKRSEMMSGIKGKNTKPEIYVRKLLFSLGYRYRLGRKDLPGKPDIVLPKYNAAIFVHGCFWHGHERCHLFRMPKSRQDFWDKKISGNIIRDETSIARLQESEWRVCVVWECAIKGAWRMPTEELAGILSGWLRSDEVTQNIRGQRSPSYIFPSHH